MVVFAARPTIHQGTAPDQPLRIVAPFVAGGGTDVMARMFAQRLSDCSIVWRRYYGALAPHSPLRAAVTALAQPAADTPAPAMIGASPSDATPAEPAHRQAARYVWALLLARIYEVLPLLCLKCGGVRGYRLRPSLRHKMKIIAFITEGAVIREIPGHLGEPISPPRRMPARGPPLREMQDSGSDPIDPQAQPAPDYEFDQRIAW